jgi:hypothetical protein
MARFSGAGGGSGTPGPAGPTGPEGPQGPAGSDGQGFNYRGTPIPSTFYYENDVVLYEGVLYIANQTTTSWPPNEAWEVFLPAGAEGADGEGFTFRGEWSNNESYVKNDVVLFNGSSFIVVGEDGPYSEGNTPYDTQVWQKNTQGLNWSGELTGTSYKFGDVVSYQGSSYIAIHPSFESPSTPSEEYWALLASKGEAGFTFRGEYDSQTEYASGDVVSSQGALYLGPQGTYNLGYPAPGEQGSSPWGAGFPWDLFLPAGESGEGFNWRGEWNEFAEPAYQNNDVIFYNGSSYVGQDRGAGSWSSPPDMFNDYWRLLASAGEGFNYMGPWQEGVQYTKNDIVSYEGSTYILPSDEYYGAIPTDTNSWNLFTSKGDSLTWRGEFNDTAIYYKNDIVSYNENLYIAKEYLFYISLSPTENSESWDLFVPKGADGDPASIDTGTTTINSYSPVWSGTGLDINPTAPVPPATGSYIKIGNLVQVQIDVNLTEVLDFGTGQYSITLPFPSLYHTDVFGGSVHDVGSGVTHYSLKGHLEDNSDVATLWTLSGSSQDQPFNNNAPVNLTTSDKFHMSFSYIANLT